MKIKAILLTLLFSSLIYTQINDINNRDSVNATDSISISAQEIIEKYIAAIGGREKLETINNKTMKLVSSVEGMKLSLTIIQKSPNKLYQELEFNVGKQTTVFDGENGKIEGMGQIQTLEGKKLEDLKYQARLNPFLDYAANNVSLELMGIESIRNRDVYKIILTTSNGKIFTHYYDIESGFKLREISKVTTTQGDFNQIIDLDDYRDANGIMNPYKLVQKMGLREIELMVESIMINSDLDDSIFEVN